jgi:hypothetical protein
MKLAGDLVEKEEISEEADQVIKDEGDQASDQSDYPRQK